MRKTVLFVLAAGVLMPGVDGAARPALAEAASQPPNLSCITERPIPNLRVRRDCEKDFVPEPPPVPEPYLTPSQIPILGPHDGGPKTDRPERDRPSAGGGGPNGAGSVD